MMVSVMMAPSSTQSFDPQPLRQVFGERIAFVAPLARLTAARVGGVADALIEAGSSGELAQVCQVAWQSDIPFMVLGGGSNVLISDAGVRGLVILNRARQVSFAERTDLPELSPVAWAESGANFGALARQAAQHGLAGLEWAAGIPGTVGGAVVGNAGAHGGSMAGNLIMAEILHRDRGIEKWPAEQIQFGYRESLLKRRQENGGEEGGLARTPNAVVLSAWLRLEPGEPQAIEARMDEYTAFRRRTQPPGASMGSMFKNPPGDYAGRLIEAAGLKNARVGDAQISPLHANFFINLGNASASDIRSLIELARRTVFNKFGVLLELEIEMVGEW
jgi:UDP-N-acetylmuramate dehydrogenase